MSGCILGLVSFPHTYFIHDLDLLAILATINTCLARFNIEPYANSEKSIDSIRLISH